MTQLEPTQACAQELDADNPLAGLSARFFTPHKQTTVYLDGNSLGLASVDALDCLQKVVDQWKQSGIEGWLDDNNPWFTYCERIGALAAPLVGASPQAVIATGATTVNLHAMLATFFQPSLGRDKILADALNFPSDIYALRSHLQTRGLDPQQHLVLVQPESAVLDEEFIVSHMGPDINLALLPSVLFRSGQLLDIAYLTRQAHKRNILIGFDCSHSVGTIEHQLEDWEVDFAVWCGYKYLNGGPGCPAFVFIHPTHFSKAPMMAGWFGSDKNRQFEMSLDFFQAEHAAAFQISTPPILALAPLEGSLRIFAQAGIERIRARSLQLTSYLICLVDALLTQAPYHFRLATPRETNRRGGHITLEHTQQAWPICQALKAAGFVPDFRPPQGIRIAPVALYNTCQQLWNLVESIQRIVDERLYEQYGFAPGLVP